MVPCVAPERVEVSVIIVNWNTRELLNHALSSLFSTEHGYATEVIVVDNGSTDGSSEMIRARWPQVILRMLNQNVGFGAANNIGFRLASGDFILLLNSDAECLPTTIRELATELQMNPDVGCVGARHINVDGSLQRSTNAFPTLLNDALELTELSRFTVFQRVLRRRFPWWGNHTARIETGWVNGACMMLRRSAIEDVGGFDEAFSLYVEEVDLCYRLRKAGWRVVFTPRAEVIHREGRSLDGRPALRVRLRYWGHAYFYAKHYSKAHHVAFCALVSVVATGRLAALLTLAALSRFGYSPSQPAWERVVNDRVRASYAEWIHAWFDILRHKAIDVRELRMRSAQWHSQGDANDASTNQS
jgi:hypothetical protein